MLSVITHTANQNCPCLIGTFMCQKVTSNGARCIYILTPQFSTPWRAIGGAIGVFFWGGGGWLTRWSQFGYFRLLHTNNHRSTHVPFVWLNDNFVKFEVGKIVGERIPQNFGFCEVRTVCRAYNSTQNDKREINSQRTFQWIVGTPTIGNWRAERLKREWIFSRSHCTKNNWI